MASQTPDELIAALKTVVKLLGATFGPDCEIVLHDLRTPEQSVVAIENGHITGRKLGDPAIGGPTADIALQRSQNDDQRTTVLANYETRTRDGRRLKSSSALFRDHRGRLCAALCLNIDLSSAHEVMRFLTALTSMEFVTDGPQTPALPAQRRPPPRGPAANPQEPAVETVVSEIITEALAMVGKPVEKMQKTDKLASVEHMYNRGLFIIRGSVELAAQALAVSRFTIYNYLDEIKRRRNEPEQDAAADAP